MSAQQQSPVREPFAAVDVIRAKRDGGRLDEPRIRWAVDAYVRGVLSEEQMAALAMAIWFRGMDREETSAWTEAMIDSGTRLDFTGLRRGGRTLPTVDKHSTGGVGDKTTLPLAPLVAAHGVAWTSSRPSPGGRQSSPTTSCWRSCWTWARWCARPAGISLRPIAVSTRCATSPPRSTPSR